MAKNVAMPDGSVVEFPDTMSDDAIGLAIKTNGFGQAKGSDIPQGLPGLPKPPNPIMTDAQPAPDEGFVSSLLNAASPAGDTGAQAAGDIVRGPAYAARHPLDSLKLLAGGLNDSSQNELQQSKEALANKDYGRAALHGLGYALPVVGPLIAKAGEQSEAHNFPGAAGTVAGLVGPALAGTDVPSKIKAGAASAYDHAFPKPAGDITSGQYSTPGDHIAASMRPNVRIDVPAEANNAHAALKEGLADRGYSTKDFNGRNGPAVLKSGLDNAMKIQEAKAQQIIDPIRNEPVDPKILEANPELKARFGDRTNLTYGDLDAERVKMNKELRRANYYSKDPTAQNAVGDVLDNTQEAVNQARDLVYGKAEAVTGVDVRPLKQTESSLLKMTDLANTTANSLSAKEAKFQATPGYKKLIQSVKKIASAKTSPVSAFSAYETPGLRSPLNEFNDNMQKAFPDLKPSKAMLNNKLARPVEFSKNDLALTHPPGKTPSPIFQRELFNQAQGLGDVHEVPGAPDLQLSHTPGETPMPIFQRMLLNQAQGVGDAHDIPGAPPAELTPSGDMPADLQRVLPLTSGAPPSEAYPGLRYPKGRK